MQFISFRYKDQIAAGLIVREGVLHLAAAGKAAGETVDLSSMLAIIRGDAQALAACERLVAAAAHSGDALLPLAQVQKLAPIPQPVRNVFCVGRNYVDHVKEGAAAMRADLKLPVAPQFFTKATLTVIGPGADVRLDRKLTQKLDYEVELAVMSGRGGRDIAASDALQHIFGYTIANDVTARDL